MCYDDVILVMMNVGCFIKRVSFLASPAVKKATDLQQQNEVYPFSFIFNIFCNVAFGTPSGI